MANSAPVNVKLGNPTVEVTDWEEEARKWRSLNAEIGGHSDFSPLTIKAAYLIGVIHSICESVSILLRDRNARLVSYIPAYGIFVSGIEVLGRCIRGNATTRESGRDLKTGFKWLASAYFEEFKEDFESIPCQIVLVQTSSYCYNISNLVALRHFAAHGQATSGKKTESAYQFGYIDYEILGHMPPLLADGLGKYWSDLQSSEDLCNKLACASIIALRKWPIYRSWSLFKADDSGVYHSVSDIFRRFDWRV